MCTIKKRDERERKGKKLHLMTLKHDEKKQMAKRSIILAMVSTDKNNLKIKIDKCIIQSTKYGSCLYIVYNNNNILSSFI